MPLICCLHMASSLRSQTLETRDSVLLVLCLTTCESCVCRCMLVYTEMAFDLTDQLVPDTKCQCVLPLSSRKDVLTALPQLGIGEFTENTSKNAGKKQRFWPLIMPVFLPFRCRTKSRRCPTYPRTASYQNPSDNRTVQGREATSRPGQNKIPCT